LSLSTQMHEWVLASHQRSLTRCWGYPCNELASHQREWGRGGVVLLTSYFMLQKPAGLFDRSNFTGYKYKSLCYQDSKQCPLALNQAKASSSMCQGHVQFVDILETQWPVRATCRMWPANKAWHWGTWDTFLISPKKDSALESHL